MLSSAEATAVYHAARDCWVRAKGNPERAEQLFDEWTLRLKGLHYELQQHWIDRDELTPSVVIDSEAAKVLGMETD